MICIKKAEHVLKITDILNNVLICEYRLRRSSASNATWANERRGFLNIAGSSKKRLYQPRRFSFSLQSAGNRSDGLTQQSRHEEPADTSKALCRSSQRNQMRVHTSELLQRP